MIFGQLVSAAMLFAKFHAGTRKSSLDFWPPLLKQPIMFTLKCETKNVSGIKVLHSVYRVSHHIVKSARAGKKQS